LPVASLQALMIHDPGCTMQVKEATRTLHPKPDPFFVTTKHTKKKPKMEFTKDEVKTLYMSFFSRACATEKSCKKDAAARVLLRFYAFERQEVLRELRGEKFRGQD
jgi:hypothetical protein